MNSVIKTNLENLYQTNFSLVQPLSFQQFIYQFIIDESQTKFVNIDGSAHFGIKGDDLDKMYKARNNKDLEKAYNRIKNMNFDSDEIKLKLKKDLNNSLSQGMEYLKSKGVIDLEHHAIFIEHDFEPYAYLRAYGEGDLPILNSPESYNFKLNKELYAGIGKVNFQGIWKYILLFENLIEALELEEFISLYKLYNNLKKSIIFKTYLMLHEVFDEYKNEMFSNIKFKSPLIIYGNEHDCESINIYAYF